MIKTEKDFKKMLRQMSDAKIKKMSEQIDVCNYPILLLKEYSRRFGLKENNSVIITTIAKQLLKEKKRRINTLKILKTEMKNLPDYYITQSGLNNISIKSIDLIHQKTKNTSSKIVHAATQIEKINNEIIRLEKLYREFLI